MNFTKDKQMHTFLMMLYSLNMVFAIATMIMQPEHGWVALSAACGWGAALLNEITK